MYVVTVFEYILW